MHSALQELCLGGTLAGLMEGGWLSTATGGLHVTRVMTILRHIASGMVHLHRLRLVNGDLDPSHVLLQLGAATEQQQLDASRNAPWTPLTREAAHALTSGTCKVKLSNFGWTCLPTGGCIMPTNSGHGALARHTTHAAAAAAGGSLCLKRAARALPACGLQHPPLAADLRVAACRVACVLVSRAQPLRACGAGGAGVLLRRDDVVRPRHFPCCAELRLSACPPPSLHISM